jgi:hypothetical protein
MEDEINEKDSKKNKEQDKKKGKQKERKKII